MNTESKIWDIMSDANEYRSFTGVNSLDSLYKFRDNKINLRNWKTPYLSLFQEEGEEIKPISDFMSGFDVITISERAMLIVKPMVGNQIEFLPLRTEIGNYFAINAKEVDCLDLKNSVIKYFDDGKRILRVIKYSFIWSALEGIDFFRVKGLGLTRLFVSDNFKEFYEKEKLTGLLFDPISMV